MFSPSPPVFLVSPLTCHRVSTAVPSLDPPMIPPTESPEIAIPRSPGAPRCQDSLICNGEITALVDVEVNTEAPEMSMVMNRAVAVSET